MRKSNLTPEQGFYTPGMSAADYLAKDKAAFVPQTIAAREGYYNGGGDGSLSYNPGTPEYLSTYANQNQAYTDWYDKALASGQTVTPGVAPVYKPGMSSADYKAQALNAYTPTTIAATPGYYGEDGTWNAPVAAHSSVYAGDQGAYRDWYKGQEAENLKYLPKGWKGGSYGVGEDGDPAYEFGGPSNEFGSTYGDTSKDALANIAYRVVGGDAGGPTYQYASYGKNGIIGTPTTQYRGVGTDKLLGALINLGMAGVLGPLAGTLGAAVSGGLGLGLGTTAATALGSGLVSAAKTGILGGDFGDSLKSGLLSAAGSALAPTVSENVGKVLPTGTPDWVSKVATGAATGAGKAVLTGDSILGGALEGGAGAGFNAATNSLGFGNSDSKLQSMLMGAVPGLLTGNTIGAITGAAGAANKFGGGPDLISSKRADASTAEDLGFGPNQNFALAADTDTPLDMSSIDKPEADYSSFIQPTTYEELAGLIDQQPAAPVAPADYQNFIDKYEPDMGYPGDEQTQADSTPITDYNLASAEPVRITAPKQGTNMEDIGTYPDPGFNIPNPPDIGTYPDPGFNVPNPPPINYGGMPDDNLNKDNPFGNNTALAPGTDVGGGGGGIGLPKGFTDFLSSKGGLALLLALLAAADKKPASGGGTTAGYKSAAPTTRTITQGKYGPIARYAADGGMINGYAQGGIATMARGRFLRGPGDGVSDSIPATIDGNQPAALADGEFVIPARVVSELGNGSSEAGARKLHAMMIRIQQDRRKTKNIAANTKVDRHLPA